MKKISPLALFVVFTVFAQQQNVPPIQELQNNLPEPVPLVPTQPIPEQLAPTAQPEQLVPTAQPQQLVPVSLPKDTLPLPPMPMPMPLPDTLSKPATDSASVVPTPTPTPITTPAPLPQDTTPQVVSPKDTTPPSPQKPSLPMNTITVDLGPTIIGVGVETAAKIFGSKLNNVDISAFGIGAQYEFQPIRFFSLPFRFAYMDFKTEVKAEKTFKKEINTTLTLDLPDGTSKDTTIEINATFPMEAKLIADLSIWSIEAHPRLYPFGGSFFVEGMAGYANLATKFSGKAIASVKMEIPEELAEFPEFSDIPGLWDTSYVVPVNFKASRGYLKYGGKLGWRVDFGKPGGFIFEHALGFYRASGIGNKTIVDQLATNIKKAAVNNPVIDVDKDKGVEVETKKFNDAFSLLEKFIFVGGPRYTFAFGWRF